MLRDCWGETSGRRSLANHGVKLKMKTGWAQRQMEKCQNEQQEYFLKRDREKIRKIEAARPASGEVERRKTERKERAGRRLEYSWYSDGPRSAAGLRIGGRKPE